MTVIVNNPVSARGILTASRTYYVRTDGSDSNTGLVNTSGGAFLTIQMAINVAATLDLAGFGVTIQVGDGTYTGTVIASVPFLGGNVTLQGNVGTPANVIISTTSANAITVNNGTTLFISGGFTVQTTTSGNCVEASASGFIYITGPMVYGASAGHHIDTQNFSYISITANYTITGSATGDHWQVSGTGQISCFSLTITLTGTPAFSTAFCQAQFGGTAKVYGNTFSGSGTGSRYNAQFNGIVYTNGAGATYLPGNSGGTTATQGQYV